MNWKNPFFVVLLLAGLLSCRREDADSAPDVSDIEVNVQIKRFEQELFKLDTNNLAAELEQLEARYPAFSQVFFDAILRSRDPQVAPQGHVAYVKGFLSHPAVRRLYDTTQVVYPRLDDIAEQYQQAFRYYKYYFPNRPIPDVTTYISEYTIGAFIYDSASLAVGLDFFLGADYPYLAYNPENSNFSAYLTRSFNREHLVAKSLIPLVEDLLGPPTGERLLDYMIYNGKSLYLLDHLLPSAPDSVLFDVTGKQAEWLADNELEMWAYFIQENLLYSSQWQDIRKYVEYSPNSPGMPPEAPGRTANYIGWQIVREYMRRNPEASLQDLVELRDPQRLFEESRYRPERRR